MKSRPRLAILMIVLASVQCAMVVYEGFPPQEAEAQQAWQPIAGTQRVVGHHPARVERRRGVYQVKQKWVPESMAVYLDGKRVSEPEDYTIAPMNQIDFGRLANERSVVIVDYEPR